jgi:hypothetical protein
MVEPMVDYLVVRMADTLADLMAESMVDYLVVRMADTLAESKADAKAESMVGSKVVQTVDLLVTCLAVL